MVKLEFRPVLVQFGVKLSFPGLRTRPGKVILSNFGNNWFLNGATIGLNSQYMSVYS